MKVRVVKRTHLVPLPLADTFEFFSNPRSVELLTPSFMKFRLMDAASGPIKPGTILNYRFQFYRIPILWRVRIESVEAPNSFDDVQVDGPFGHWRHRQTFSRSGDKATEIRDRFEFGLPFGRIGEFVYQIFVKAKLRALFDYRANQMDRLMHRYAPRDAGAAANPAPTSHPQS